MSSLFRLSFYSMTCVCVRVCVVDAMVRCMHAADSFAWHDIFDGIHNRISTPTLTRSFCL